MEGSQDSDYDYIIVGGGIAGCTLASRLQEILGKSSSILLLEAGPDPSSNPNTKTPMEGFALAGSELDWAYKTAPIPTLADRVFTLTSGKTLGGGSVLSKLNLPEEISLTALINELRDYFKRKQRVLNIIHFL